MNIAIFFIMKKNNIKCNSVICVFISFNWKKKPLDKENIKWVIKQTVMRRGEGVSVCGITHD